MKRIAPLVLTAVCSIGTAIAGLVSADGGAEPAAALPPHLRDTGLYAAGSSARVRDGILPFSPQYPLWSDGTKKQRWVYLPPGTTVDASNPDEWEFPVGTRLWKEFSLERRIETRMIERLADGSWR